MTLRFWEVSFVFGELVFVLHFVVRVDELENCRSKKLIPSSPLASLPLGLSAAKSARLQFLVGGTQPAFEAAEPLLKLMGNKVTHCGASGAGLSVKLISRWVQDLSPSFPNSFETRAERRVSSLPRFGCFSQPDNRNQPDRSLRRTPSRLSSRRRFSSALLDHQHFDRFVATFFLFLLFPPPTFLPSLSL